jgi:hypothetical protein
MTTRASDDAWVRYGGARPSCVLGPLWLGVATWRGVTTAPV